MKIRHYVLLFIFYFSITPHSIFCQEYKYEKANNLIKGAEYISKEKSNQGYSFVRMSGQSNIAAGEKLSWLKSTVLQCRPTDDLKEVKNENDNLGFTHCRYQQYYSGIPVIGGNYIVHVRNGKVESANGIYFEKINLNVQPGIDSAKARELSFQNLNSKRLLNEVIPVTQLVIICFTGTCQLAYKTNIYSLDPLKHINLYLDANTGEVIYEENLINDVDAQGTAETIYSGNQTITTNQLSPNSYVLYENARNIHTHTSNHLEDFGGSDIYDADNYWDNTVSQINAAYDLHFGLEKTYDYFLNTYGRISLDNAGIEIHGYANYGLQYNNAFWDQIHLAFGDGDGVRYNQFTSLEVVGHEYTHGVTYHTAQLVNFMDPGALNESFSDIFGTVIDFKIHPATADYQIGEGISVSGLPFRSMANPKDYGSPDTYLGQFWDYGIFFGGNPHINNGPANYYFYLLSEGGSGENDNGDTYFIRSIGRDSAAAIAFRALTVYLTGGASYLNARDASIQSAIDLFGSCSDEVIQVTNAWYAVGVGLPYTDAVVAGFGIPQTTYCHIPVTIQFTNHSINASSYSWDFGDGSNSNIPEPTHVYSLAGSYNIRLIGSGASICNSVDTFSITVNISSGGPAAVSCQPQSISPCCMSGIFKVDLNDLHNTSGSAEEGYRDFTCTKIAHLTAGQYYPVSVLTGNLLKENLKAWIDYNNDGVFDNLTELAFETFDNLRTHSSVIYTDANCVLNTPLRLRIISEISYNDIVSPCYQPLNGQVEDYSIIFSPNTQPPVADFASSDTFIQPGSTIDFNDRTINGPLSWQWEFTGGFPAFSVLQNPSVAYLTPGIYRVKLTVSNSFGIDSIVRITYVHVSAHYFVCESPSITNAMNGELENPNVDYVPGGNTNCTFQINLPCITDIHFSFSHFNVGHNGSFKIYDGLDFSAPLILSTISDSLPLIMPVAHSGTAFIVLSYIDYSYPLDTAIKFNMAWSSSHPNNNIQFAAFTFSNQFPPVNSPIQFINLSGNTFNHLWDFGDGFVSNVMNPWHAYASTGSYTVQLIDENCISKDTIAKIINVQPDPNCRIHPLHIDTTFACGDSVVLPISITNSGPGDLLCDLHELQDEPKKIQVLVLAFGARTQDEIPNALASASNFCKFNVIIYSGTDPAELENLLLNIDVILVPGNYFDKPLKYLGLGPVVRNYVEKGGGIIFLNGSPDYLGNFHSLGLLHPINYRWSYGQVTFPVSSHPLVNNVPTHFTLPDNTHALTFSNPDLVKLITFGGFDVLSYRYQGSGKVVFLAFDYYTYNGSDINHQEASQIIANTFIWASKTHPSPIQINTPVVSASLQAGDSLAIPVIVHGLAPGNQILSVVINTNQPSHPSDTVIINAIVSGSPVIHFLSPCVHFPNSVDFIKRIDTIRFVNAGCGALLIDSIESSSQEFSVKSFSAQLDEGDTGNVVVEFYPVHTGFLNSNFTIYSNIFSNSFCADGNAIAASAISPSVDSLVFNLNCNSIIQSPITITNTGGGPLSVLTNRHTAVPGSVRILIYNGVIFSQSITALENSIRQNCPDCIISHLSSFSESAVTYELAGKDIFILGPTSLMSVADPNIISPVIKNFVDAGGDVIFWNQSNPNHYFTGSGLMAGYVYGTSRGEQVDLIDSTFPGFNNFPTHFLTSQTSYVTSIQNNNKIPLLGIAGNDFTTYLRSGKGYAYYVANDLRLADSVTLQIIPGIINTIKEGRLPTWINLSLDSFVVNAGNPVVMNVNINTQGMHAGQYSGDIIFNTNAYPQFYDTIHCKINIVGNEDISLSQSCITFDTVYAGGNSIDTLKIFNTGCDTLFILNMHSNSASIGIYPPFILPFDSVLLRMQFTATSAGQNFDTLFIRNSDHDTSVCLKIAGLNPPIISSFPDSFDITLNCGDSTTTFLNITNNGLSPLLYSINHRYDEDSIEVAILTIDATRYSFTNYFIPGFRQRFPLSKFKIITSSNLDTVQKELRNMDVLIVAWYPYYVDTSVFLLYAPLIGNFGMNGGTVIFTYYSSSFPSLINASGLFNYTMHSSSYPNPISIVNPHHPLVYDLPSGIPTNGSEMLCSLANPDKVSIATYNGYDLFAYRRAGNGTAIFIGTTDLNNYLSQIMIANSIRWAGTTSHSVWLHTIPSGNVITPMSSSNVTVNINSNGLTTGIYLSNIIISSNDPSLPLDSVHVKLHVVGNAAITLNNSCVNFGNVQVNTTLTGQLLVTNSGCDTLFLDSTNHPLNIQSNIAVDTLTPGDSSLIFITIHPTLTGNFNSSLLLFTNAGDTTICLQANVESDPAYSCSQNSIQVTIGCDDSVIVPLTINNLHGGNLHVVNSSYGGASTGRILVLTYGVDTVNLLPTLISSIRQFYNSFQISYLNSPDTSVLRNALNYFSIVMYPQTSSGSLDTIINFRYVLDNFIQNGGKLIIFGAGNNLATYSTSYLGSDYDSYSNAPPIDVLDYSTPLTDNIPNYFQSSGMTLTKENAYFNSVAYDEYYYGSVLGYNNVNTGRAIFDGLDYSYPVPEESQIAANAVKWCVNSQERWIVFSSDSIDIAGGASAVINLQISSVGFPTGIFRDTIILQTNDPLNLYDTIPLMMNVIGQPSILTSDTCLSFIGVPENTQSFTTFTLSNPGCDTLIVTSFSTSSSLFTVHPLTVMLAPGLSSSIDVQFSPMAAGIYADTLKIFSNAGLVKICLQASAIGSSSVTVGPTSFNIAINCHDTLVRQLTINNSGNAPLNFHAGVYSFIDTLVRISCFASSYSDYSNITTLLQNYHNYVSQVYYYSSLDSIGFAQDLNNSDVVVLCRSYGTNLTPSMNERLRQFVRRGGTAIILDTDNYGLPVLNTELFHGTFTYFYLGASADILVPSHPITDSIFNPISNPGVTTFNFTDPDKTKIIDFAGMDVLTIRNELNGRVIFDGIPTYQLDLIHSKLFENMIRWSGELSHQRNVHTSSPTITVLPGTSTQMSLSFTSGNRHAGVYVDTLICYTNDPLHPAIAITYQLTITGGPVVRLSNSCIDFGQISSTSASQVDTLFNDGCTTLNVTGISHSDSSFNVSSQFIQVNAGSFELINVQYSSLAPGTQLDTILILTTTGDTTICLSADPIIPLVDFNPDSFYVTLGSCHDSVTLPLTYQNNGGGNLQVTLLNSDSLGKHLEVLAFTYGTDIGNEYPNTIRAIREFASRFNLSELNSSDTSALRIALNGKDVLLIPEPEFSDPTVFTNMDSILQEFVSLGGTIIFCGASGTQSSCIFNTGLFHGYFSSNVGGDSLVVNLPSDPIASGVDPAFIAPSGTYSVSITDTNKVLVVSHGTDDVVTYRSIGSGRAVFLAFDYFIFNTNSARLIANAIETFGPVHHHDWIEVDPTSQTILAADSGIFNLTFTTTSLYYGTHIDTLLISSNDPFHLMDTIICTLDVNQHFCADFGYNRNCDGLISFLDSSSNNPTSWYWDFGDSSSSIERNPLHQYLLPGNYAVMLVASNASDNDTIQYVVSPHFAQSVLIGDSGIYMQGGMIYFYSNDSTGLTRTWIFGDGTQSTSPNPIHAYSSQGVYTVGFSATDASGCTFTDSISVVIINVSIDEPSSLFSASIYPNPCKDETVLSYTLEKSTPVEINLYDLMGRKVKNIVNSIQQTPGKYILHLKISTTGFYFVTLRQGDNLKVFKIISTD